MTRGDIEAAKEALAYIASSPPPEHGGFHAGAVNAAERGMKVCDAALTMLEVVKTAEALADEWREAFDILVDNAVLGEEKPIIAPNIWPLVDAVDAYRKSPHRIEP